MIRQARKDDARVCIDLLNLAMQDIAFTLSGTEQREQSDEILREFFANQGNRISYENVYVYEIDGTVVGAICGYFGADLSRLDEPICRHLKNLNIAQMPEIECEEDEFYIDSVAVDESFRGRGIARQLILFLCQRAALQFDKISLIVEENKKAERAFYERLGFEFNKERIVNNHRYFHLIKGLK